MLSDEKCRMIYDAALTIIAEIGMTVPHAEAREILVKGAGATVEGEDSSGSRARPSTPRAPPCRR